MGEEHYKVEVSRKIQRGISKQAGFGPQNKAALRGSQVLGGEDKGKQETSQDDPTEGFLATLEEGRERFLQLDSDEAAPRSLEGV